MAARRARKRSGPSGAMMPGAAAGGMRLPNPTTYTGWKRAYDKARMGNTPQDQQAFNWLVTARFVPFIDEHERRKREKRYAETVKNEARAARRRAQEAKAAERKNYTYTGWKRALTLAKERNDSEALRKLESFRYREYQSRLWHEQYDREEAKARHSKEDEIVAKERASGRYQQARKIEAWLPMAEQLARGKVRSDIKPSDSPKSDKALEDKAMEEWLKLTKPTPHRLAYDNAIARPSVVRLYAHVLQARYFARYDTAPKKRAEWATKAKQYGNEHARAFDAAYKEELPKARKVFREMKKAKGGGRKPVKKRTPTATEKHRTEVFQRYMAAATAYRDNRTAENKRKAEKAYAAWKALEAYYEKRPGHAERYYVRGDKKKDG